MTDYAPEYQPANARHFRDMTDQFTKAPTADDVELLTLMWLLDLDVSRQDILVASERARRLKESSMHECADDEIFVFGSNTTGNHGRGAAKDALDHYGAVYGQGVGRQGQSYGLPTKGPGGRTTLPLDIIRAYVEEFLTYARDHPDTKFFLTKVGCGLAGYTDSDIVPMFKSAPPNVRKPPGW